jgi:hypothetical protein
MASIMAKSVMADGIGGWRRKQMAKGNENQKMASHQSASAAAAKNMASANKMKTA